MENQNQAVIHPGLSEHFVSEITLMAVLNIGYNTLQELRLTKGFPVCQLNVRNRVYPVKEVLAWLEEHIDH